MTSKVLIRKQTLLIAWLLFISVFAKAKDDIGVPQSCTEIKDFTTLVLDSSYFFKEDVTEKTSHFVSSIQYEDCEYYPQALTIFGFQKYISNHTIESRNALLRADSLYTAQEFYEHKYFIRNKIFLGLNYSVANDTIKSVRYLNEALELSKKLNNLKLLADAQHNLGNVYLNIDLIDKASVFIKAALVNAIESGNLEIEAFANLTLSRISSLNGEPELALEAVNKSEAIFKAMDNLRNLYIIDMRKAEIYIDIDQKDKAIQRLLSAEKIGNAFDNKFLHSQIYVHLGNLYKPTNEKKAIKYFELAFKNSANLIDSEFSKLIDILTDNYNKEKEYDKLKLLLDDLSVAQQTRKELMRVELQESNRKEIEFQKEINEKEILNLKVKTHAKRTQLILLASLICLMFALYAFRQLKKNRSLTEQIADQNKLLENQNTELKNFASVVSHDLKAPARTIASFASLLRKKLPEESDEKIFEYLDIINNCSTNMHELVTSLLDFSTLEQNPINLMEVSSIQIIKDVQDNLFKEIESKKAKIHISENLPEKIYVDRALIKIVFQNLITNAIKFVPPDKTPIVEVKYEDAGKYHKLMFIDNGIGIDQKNLEKVFLIFQRLHNATEYEGSGIGLATCQKIIDMHKGKIELSSTVNEGSNFMVYLPKQKAT